MMPGTAKSSVITANPKPNNVFYIWYTELCRRLNSNPAAFVRPAKPKCNTVLDFAADRLKFEDWNPLINALRNDTSLHVINIRSRMSNYQFLHDVDSEDKARRMKRKYGSLWTSFVLNSLVGALSSSIKHSQVLTCLELDGLPMFSQYLDALLKALKENRTVKNFSLTNCSIQDAGCRSVCLCLQDLPNVEWLNLSRCDLQSVSGIYLAKLIKFQQLNRYTTSWHKSLRYSEPDAERMCGIRRVTLNCNLKLGDDGLSAILDVLEDDLWMKALDMQKCGLTEEVAPKLLDILQYNKSLLIADFRQNDGLFPITLERVLDILRRNNANEDTQSKFQWCNTIMSLSPSTMSASSRPNSICPCDKMFASVERINGTRRGITTGSRDMVKKNILNCADNVKPLDATKRKFIQLKVREDQNHEKKNGIVVSTEDTKKCVNRINHLNGESHVTHNVLKTFGKLKLFKNLANMRDATHNAPTNTPIRKTDYLSQHAPKTKTILNEPKNGFKTPQRPHYVSPGNNAGTVFETYFEGMEEKKSPTLDETEQLLISLEGIDLTNNSGENEHLQTNDMSNSQLSLVHFLEELKNDHFEKSSDPKTTTSKHHYRGKKNGIK